MEAAKVQEQYFSLRNIAEERRGQCSQEHLAVEGRQHLLTIPFQTEEQIPPLLGTTCCRHGNEHNIGPPCVVHQEGESALVPDHNWRREGER